MRNLLSFVFLLSCVNVFGQTYYTGKKQTVDVNISVKKPPQQINYAELGQQFTNMMYNNIASREELKKALNEFKNKVSQAIIENTILTNDYLVDGYILKVQNKFLEEINLSYKTVLTGYKAPGSFQQTVEQLSTNYMISNNHLIRLKSYLDEKLEIEPIIENILEHIIEFKIGKNNSVELVFENIYQEERILINEMVEYIEQFVRDKSLYDRKLTLFQEEKIRKELEELKKKRRKDSIILDGNNFIQRRKDKLELLSMKERQSYFKSEYKFLKSQVSPKTLKWNFGKSKEVESHQIESLVYRIGERNFFEDVLILKSLRTFCECD